jgi:hypothetical protein
LRREEYFGAYAMRLDRDEAKVGVAAECQL